MIVTGKYKSLQFNKLIVHFVFAASWFEFNASWVARDFTTKCLIHLVLQSFSNSFQSTSSPFAFCLWSSISISVSIPGYINNTLQPILKYKKSFTKWQIIRINSLRIFVLFSSDNNQFWCKSHENSKQLYSTFKDMEKRCKKLIKYKNGEHQPNFQMI